MFGTRWEFAPHQSLVFPLDHILILLRITRFFFIVVSKVFSAQIFPHQTLPHFPLGCARLPLRGGHGTVDHKTTTTTTSYRGGQVAQVWPLTVPDSWPQCQMEEWAYIKPGHSSPARDFAAPGDGEGFCMPSPYTAKPATLQLSSILPGYTKESCLLQKKMRLIHMENQREAEMKQRQSQ